MSNKVCSTPLSHCFISFDWLIYYSSFFLLSSSIWLSCLGVLLGVGRAGDCLVNINDHINLAIIWIHWGLLREIRASFAAMAFCGWTKGTSKSILCLTVFLTNTSCIFFLVLSILSRQNSNDLNWVFITLRVFLLRSFGSALDGCPQNNMYINLKL